MIFQNLNKEQINTLSKFIVLHAFRNGPIEDIHSADRISQEEIKEIMQHAVTNMAAIIDGLTNERGPYILDRQWSYMEIRSEWNDPDWSKIEKMNAQTE